MNIPSDESLELVDEVVSLVLSIERGKAALLLDARVAAARETAFRDALNAARERARDFSYSSDEYAADAVCDAVSGLLPAGEEK